VAGVVRQCAWTVTQCHPERSEGSVAIGTEILSEAKDDRAGSCWCWGTVKCIWTMPYGWFTGSRLCLSCPQIGLF